MTGVRIVIRIEEATLSTSAHGMEPKQDLLQQFLRIEGLFLSVVVLIGVLNDGVKVGKGGVLLRVQPREICIICDIEVIIEPLQHNLDGVNVPVLKGFVAAEEVLEEGDVLGEDRSLPEGGWSGIVIFGILAP